MRPNVVASSPENGRTCTVGLVADPGLPAEIAGHVAEQLPAALATGVSSGVCWRVGLVCEALPLDERGAILVVEQARTRKPAEGWDLMVCLTDLPRRAGAQPIVSDVSIGHGAALVSLPAIGWVRLRRHVRDTVVHVVYEMTRDTLASEPGQSAAHRAFRRRPTELVSPVRHVPAAAGDDIHVYLALVGVRGKARLLFGMVRNNRPWRLVPYLASAVAAAAAGAAFGVFYGSIWTIADALSPARLAVINVFAVAIMVIWLVVYNNLWESRRRAADPGKAALYNTATVLTVALGVWCAYALLFAITLAAAGVVIAAALLQAKLGHPVGWTDYATIAWMASSMGTVAGALGSTFESDDAVREATYSRREQERRARARQREARTGHGDAGE